MTTPRAGAHHVVIGASAAGVSAAVAMRTSGFEGRITLLDASAYLPYERPPLSKTFPVTLRPIVSEQAYADHGIELRRGARVAELDAVTRAVVLEGGERLPADAVLLATGVSARMLGVPGERLGNVLTLRDADDAARVAARLDAGGPLVIVGAGFIGLEAAAVARARGLDVTVVELLPVPLLPVLGADAGGRVRRLHEDRGVRFRLGATAAEKAAAQGKTPVVGADFCRPKTSLITIRRSARRNGGALATSRSSPVAPGARGRCCCRRWRCSKAPMSPNLATIAPITCIT